MAKTQGKVHSIISNLVLVKVEGPVSQNEICFIEVKEERLMAEVIKVVGDLAYVQVFESTRGLKPGMLVEFQNHMLEVSLGPGLLSKNFDGLQNDLDKMTGVFLKRGEYTNPLEDDKKWSFTPLAKAGDKVKAADWLGNVKENWLDHKIMVPFKLEGEYTVVSIVSEGEYTIKDTVAVLKDDAGKEYHVSMVQKWPVVPGLFPVRSVPVKRCYSMLWRVLQMPMSLSWRLVASGPMRWWKSLRNFRNYRTRVRDVHCMSVRRLLQIRPICRWRPEGIAIGGFDFALGAGFA